MEKNPNFILEFLSYFKFFIYIFSEYGILLVKLKKILNILLFSYNIKLNMKYLIYTVYNLFIFNLFFYTGLGGRYCDPRT